MQAACTALHMPPAVSTHPREPEIRRLAEAAAGELAARASTQPQSGVGTREKANRGSALPTPSKEDPKCSLNFTLSSNIQRNSQSAFCPNAIGCKKLSWLDPCGTSWRDVDSSHLGFPVGSSQQSLSLATEHSLLFQVFFLWQIYCKGLRAHPVCGLPASKAGVPSPYLPTALVAQ